MPHIVLECSGNVQMDFQLFFKELGKKLVATGHVPRLGLKCRVSSSDDYFIVNGDPNLKMVNLSIKLREGRSDEIKRQISNIGMELLEKHLEKEVSQKEIIVSTQFTDLIKEIDLTSNKIRNRDSESIKKLEI